MYVPDAEYTKLVAQAALADKLEAEIIEHHRVAARTAARLSEAEARLDEAIATGGTISLADFDVLYGDIAETESQPKSTAFGRPVVGEGKKTAFGRPVDDPSLRRGC